MARFLVERNLGLQDNGSAGGLTVIGPNDYYRGCDYRADTMSDIKRCIDVISGLGKDRGCKVFWRGQANHEWGLISSLARKLALTGVVDERVLDKVERALLEEASSWISELKAPLYAGSLAKLAYLQHHGVPTRLLDFTANPWMAVFFASEALDEVDGRVFAIIVRPEDVLKRTPSGRPWRKYKTSQVKIYDPAKANLRFDRLVAQGGVLALGRLPSTQPIRQAHDEVCGRTRNLLAEEVRRILSIPFKLSKFDPTPAYPAIPSWVTTPIGLTFRIHVNKESIRRDLSGNTKGRRISPQTTHATHQTVYPDASGMVEHSRTLRGLNRGVFVL
jgi:hypothetical protein